MIEWYGEQVETIVISVISMLSDPTDESPANIDAAVSMFRPFEYICMHALSERAITTFSWLCGCASRSFHMPPELWPSDTIFPLFLDLGIRVATNLFFFAECLQARRKRQSPKSRRIDAVDLPDFTEISVFLGVCRVFFALASTRPAAACRLKFGHLKFQGPGIVGKGCPWADVRDFGWRAAVLGRGAPRRRTPSGQVQMRADFFFGEFIDGNHHLQTSIFFSSSSFCVELICADAFCRRSSGMTTLDTRRG